MDKKLIALCMALAVSLCLAQVLGSTVLIIACLVSIIIFLPPCRNARICHVGL